MRFNNETECKAAFARLDALIAEGFEGIPEKEKEFSELALAIEAWEDGIPLMPIPVPEHARARVDSLLPN